MNQLNDEFADFLEKSELAQEFRNKQRKDLETKRAAAIDARTLCENELEAVRTKMTDLKVSYTESAKRLDEERKKLDQEAQGAFLPLSSRRRELEREISGHDSFLLTNYEKDIAAAVKFFTEKQREAMTTPIIYAKAIGEKKLSGRAEYFIRSNRDGILNRVEYCRAAIQEIEAMKLSCAQCDTRRILQLKEGLPDIRETNERTGWVDSPSLMGAILGS
ncbi:MAG: hypothetical protein PHY82_09985 [Lentisphaeria bacterium]|nr:hypothetical protein [Lentisphaeria bacterium]